MIHEELLRDRGILIITPKGPLEKSDFVVLAREIDPYIEEKGALRGLMIYAKAFPGWNDFGTLVSHLAFVKNHERFIPRIATVSDSAILTIMPQIAAHFIHAEVRHFDFDDRDAALAWLGGE
ncbi:MAG: STAS/SEC14 domain-containing protein [Casimicrobiaceae bacterium]